MIARLYERNLLARVRSGPLPRHIGIVMDGNRRWARQEGLPDANLGHHYGGRHVTRVLGWCTELGIEHVTVFVASTDNLTSRPQAELQHLMTVIEDVVAVELSRPGGPWRVRLAGRIDMLPDSTARALKEAVEATRERPARTEVTIAIGYGGRDEIVDAVRSMLDAAARDGIGLRELAGRVTDDAIAAHLYTAGTPDPELVIRTSGEQRLSGFLLWQSTHANLHFCDVYWPGFRRIDLLRALRAYVRDQARR
ncbi:polyprenyl diphosphate synthase [Pseudonocardia sp. GCM10023141]|uniref:polyprenyl diphosphate synthase n=1 Tax=Pseudonocardia sp. GCM10023141 TaxID=3252653 RepID=UPI003615FE7D